MRLNDPDHKHRPLPPLPTEGINEVEFLIRPFLERRSCSSRAGEPVKNGASDSSRAAETVRELPPCCATEQLDSSPGFPRSSVVCLLSRVWRTKSLLQSL